MAFDAEKIEGRLDRAVVAGTEVSMTLGGVQVKDMGELLEIARLMSLSGPAVPYHLRGQPGTCLAVCIRALRFGFDPFTLAEHSYTMKKSQKNDHGQWEEIETVAYDSFVIRAIIDAHAQLTGKIEYTYEGEGDDMVCIASAIPKGATKPLVTRSERLGAMKDARGRNDKGQIKGSPLWDTKPQQQLAYSTGRDFCRMHFPSVLLGWYDRDEMDENVAPERKIEPTPTSGLRARLAKPKDDAKGFDAAAANKTIDGELAKNEPKAEKAPSEQPAPLAEPKSPDPASSPAAPSEAAAVAAPQPEATSAEATTAAAAESVPLPAMAALAEATEAVGGVPEDIAAIAAGAAITAAAIERPAPEKREIDAPTDGLQYRAYVQATLMQMTDPDEPKKWWSSAAQRKLRNALPNIDQDILDACKADVVAIAEQLKPKGNAQ